jgi:hypothetical protein
MGKGDRRQSIKMRRRQRLRKRKERLRRRRQSTGMAEPEASPPEDEAK